MKSNNRTLLTPNEAVKLIQQGTPSSLEAIHNNGFLTKYWWDAKFFYDKAEIECLKGLDFGAIMGYGGDVKDHCTELNNRLSKLK